MKINQFAIATIATLVLGGSLVAQQPLPGEGKTVKPRAKEGQVIRDQDGRDKADRADSKRADSKQRSLAGSSQLNDRAFAKCLAITNQEQVMIARFAKDKATHDDVKSFASTLEKEHQSYYEELNEISSTDGSRGISDKEGSKSEGQSAGNVDFVRLHQEISEQFLKDTKETLGQKEGVEFDKCFVGMQVAKHAAMHSTLTVFERHATGDLRGLIKEGLDKNARHSKAAVKLMEQLVSIDSAKTSARTE